ncbi:MAG: Nif3-like dinuclear metal center hexameric protein [Eubacterium sp.]|nr:Nif3-like dinuclear metal center hexameric protein [Eubacterium sp.]
MRCDEILKKLEEEYPLECAEDWDNPGLLVGHRNQKIQKILVALDATEEIIQQAIDSDADMIITHHPLLFHSIRNVNDDSFLGRRLLALIENGIACYAMHTNFDVLGMALLNEQQLELKNTHVLDVTDESDGVVEGIGRVGEWEEPRSLMQAAEFVHTKLGLDAVRCYGLEQSLRSPEPEKIHRVAVCGGSGKSVIEPAIEESAQVLITGDIDYHTAIDALAQGLYIIDAGHYGTEYGFIAYMANKIRKLFPDIETEEARIHQPYQVVAE